MERRLDLARWRRRHHFEYFRDFAQPFFGLCAEVDVTRLVERSTLAGTSFFLGSLHASLLAANSVTAFRLRLRDRDTVVEHDQVDCSSTVLRDDDTFAFASFDFIRDRQLFLDKGAQRVEEARQSEGLPADTSDATLFFSVLPWFRLTSFSHARRGPGAEPSLESVPRIVLGGRFEQESGVFKLPVSIEVHHALADGIDVARFLEKLQQELDS